MLTFLTVEKQAPTLFAFLNKITAETKTVQGIELKHINCIHRHGKLNFEKIAKLCGEDAHRLLCKEDLTLPEDSGLFRFECDELKVRLSLNMAIELLKLCRKSSKPVKVAVFDPDGRIADGVGVMLKYTDSVTVVTRMTGLYSAEASRLMEESGAVLTVSKRMKSLNSAHLVVAPLKLRCQLPIMKEAVVLASAYPAASQKAAVYFKYYFSSLSDELLKYIPEGLDSEYFASALYTLCSRHELGSIVPQVTKGVSASHTLVSMAKYLMNIACDT